MKVIQLLSPERDAYYAKVKARRQAQNAMRDVVRQDAVFIHYYGMDAFLKLYPDAVDNSMEWHNAVVLELRAIEQRQLADTLVGIQSAVSASLYRKAAHRFARTIRNMRR